MLRIERLSCLRDGLPVLHEVDLEVKTGELVALVGPCGAGKTTLLRCVSRLAAAEAERLELEGADLRRLLPHQVAALGLAHVPSRRQVFPGLTVVDQLRLGAWHPAARRNRERAMERAFALFPALAVRRTTPGAALSGGELQMLALARALMAEPKLLLLDEPSLGLSPLLARSLVEVVRELHGQGTTVLVAEQGFLPWLRLASRGYLLSGGRVVRTGSGPELLADPEAKCALLGTSP
jgi:branched-chain amino acid transport system ATP-binding protein